MDSHVIHLVVYKGKRPDVPTNVNMRTSVLPPLMRRCWSQEPRKRPSFEAVLEILNAFHLAEFKCTLEEMIKKRCIDEMFDDPVRRPSQAELAAQAYLNHIKDNHDLQAELDAQQRGREPLQGRPFVLRVGGEEDGRRPGQGAVGEAGLVDDGERVEALGEDPFPGVQEEPGRLVRGDALRRRPRVAPARPGRACLPSAR